MTATPARREDGDAGPPDQLIAELEQALRALDPAVARELCRRVVGPLAGDRSALPARRAMIAQKANIGGRTIYLHTGEFADGRLGEIFVRGWKDGETESALLNCFAIAVSIGLQHGAPADAYVDSFLFTKFAPDGLVRGDHHIKMARSVIDYVARRIAIDYLGRTDLVQAHAQQGPAAGDQQPGV